MRTSGTVEVEMIMGDEEYVLDMDVAPIADDLLLGCDFLDEHDVTINTRRGLEIKEKWVDCHVDRKQDKVSRVLVSETTTIPSSSEALIPGKSENSQLIETCFAAIEPALGDLPDVLVAPCLVDPYKPKIPVQDYTEVLDSCGYPLLLEFKKHEYVKSHEFTVKMKCKPSLIPKDWEDTEVVVLRNKADVPQLPEYLKELYEESCKKIPCSEEKIKREEILFGNKDAIAQNKTGVDTCTIITNRIDIGGAVPIGQPLKRTTHAFELEDEWKKRKMEEMKRMVQEIKRTVEEKRKAESERSKFESENRNLGNYIVRLEKRVESQRKEKDDRKRGRDILREKQCVGVVNSYVLDGFDELWQDEERVCKRVKSVVIKPRC